MTLHELRLQICSGYDFAIVQGGYDVQAKWLVMMEVGDEDFVCHGMLLFLWDTKGRGPINRRCAILGFSGFIRLST